MDRSYNFQVNLRGLLDLLSHNLCSTPAVFMREILQNGVDAVTARVADDPAHTGLLRFELHDGPRPTLVFEDNGIGLTETEIHEFLASIGSSSKRDDLGELRADFIGRFGIGLLSCFMVADELVLITRSARPENPAWEWRGRPDGTYSLTQLKRDTAPGSSLFLHAKPEMVGFFRFDSVLRTAREYGGLLPVSITVSDGDRAESAALPTPPWRRNLADNDWRQAALAYGSELFEETFFDALPLRAPSGGVRGCGFISAHHVGLGARQAHRVYLKGMLLADNITDLLPSWAFFCRCILDAEKLAPTAARESFYENEALAETRKELEDCLRHFLVGLRDYHPERLAQFLDVHRQAVQAWAVDDDECYRLFIDVLPFETTTGTMTMGEIRREQPVIRYLATVDQFRRVATVATAQGICVVNGGYVYTGDLLERLPLFFDNVVQVVEPSDITGEFTRTSRSGQSASPPSVGRSWTKCSQIWRGATVNGAAGRRSWPV